MSNQIILIEPKHSKVGTFTVKRYLPRIKKRSVGPFIFVDTMVAIKLPAGKGVEHRIGRQVLVSIQGKTAHSLATFLADE